MMPRWLICFSVACALEAATVQGTVRLVDSKEQAVRARRDYSGVVVWLEPNGAPAPPGAEKTIRMIQKNKRFDPHVLAIRVGDTVDFPNYDPIFHNAFSNFSGQPFDIGLYAPGTSRKVRFRRDGIVRVFCNIHPTMSAVIVVLKTPYAAVSEKSGRITIRGVPPGHYRLHVFHERASPEGLAALGRDLRVDGPDVPLPELVISESGYLRIPHKNKHGQDYPAVIEDVPAYPGRKP